MSGIAGEDLPEFWRGCITGTNRASVLARLRREGATVRARVLLDDTVNGPAVCTLIGTLDGTHADLRLLSFAPSAPQFPVAVSLTLDFRDNNQRATGSWASDVATAGVCELVAAHVPESVWWWKLGTTYAGLLVQSPSYYATTLLVVAALSLLRLLHLTYPVLVLILIPALFVFRQHIRALIDYFGLTKAGPFEFQRIQAPGETLEGVRAVLRGGISLLGGELAKVVNDEAVAFLALDWFFAPRTKLMLLWLSQRESVAISEFNETAARLGIPPDNLAATWAALLGTGAAAVADGRTSLTREGKRYASHLLLASAL